MNPCSDTINMINSSLVIICSGRRTSQTKFINYLPSMMVTTLDDDVEINLNMEKLDMNSSSHHHPLALEAQVAPSTIANTSDGKISTDKTKDVVGAMHEFENKLLTPTASTRKTFRTTTKTFRSSASLSPIRHSRTPSDTDFSALIIPNL